MVSSLRLRPEEVRGGSFAHAARKRGQSRSRLVGSVFMARSSPRKPAISSCEPAGVTGGSIIADAGDIANEPPPGYSLRRGREAAKNGTPSSHEHSRHRHHRL